VQEVEVRGQKRAGVEEVDKDSSDEHEYIYLYLYFYRYPYVTVLRTSLTRSTGMSLAEGGPREALTGHSGPVP
jgi:hypothetical protein